MEDLLSFSCCILFSLMAKVRYRNILEKNWKFTKGEVTEAMT
jgi:beta-galactosidase